MDILVFSYPKLSNLVNKFYLYFCDLLKQSTVFFNKHAIVIGPTPPGTGVSALATFETSSNATSPTKPFSVLLIPTSITIASFLTQSPFTSSGIPTAARIISASKHSAF